MEAEVALVVKLLHGACHPPGSRPKQPSDPSFEGVISARRGHLGAGIHFLRFNLPKGLDRTGHKRPYLEPQFLAVVLVLRAVVHPTDESEGTSLEIDMPPAYPTYSPRRVLSAIANRTMCRFNMLSDFSIEFVEDLFFGGECTPRPGFPPPAGLPRPERGDAICASGRPPFGRLTSFPDATLLTSGRPYSLVACFNIQASRSMRLTTVAFVKPASSWLTRKLRTANGVSFDSRRSAISSVFSARTCPMSCL